MPRLPTVMAIRFPRREEAQRQARSCAASSSSGQSQLPTIGSHEPYMPQVRDMLSLTLPVAQRSSCVCSGTVARHSTPLAVTVGHVQPPLMSPQVPSILQGRR